MTIQQAATHIQRQLGCARGYALAAAWQCKREADQAEEAKRQQFFRARRQQCREERFLKRLRAARILTGDERAREGGGGPIIEMLPVLEDRSEEPARLLPNLRTARLAS